MTKKILLTGAGFTHNFGSPLASEMSGLIFNAVSSKELRDILREDFDYESLYQRVIQSQDYSVEMKHEFSSAVSGAYNKIDKLITNRPLSEILDVGRFVEFISWFDKIRGGGFIFSLNQDLLIENHINNHTLYTLQIMLALQSPIVDVSNSYANPIASRKFNYIIGDKDVDETITEFNKKFSKDEASIYYIKMHGSQNWFRQDDQQIMIIGHGKRDRIKSDKLLAWYADIFKNQLALNDTKLLIIGYGFGDEHINQEIYNNRDNLSMYVVNPQPFKDL
ncbi:MAG: hypothetical protein ABI597_04615 [Gammaproteobacteria bacterium]